MNLKRNISIVAAAAALAFAGSAVAASFPFNSATDTEPPSADGYWIEVPANVTRVKVTVYGAGGGGGGLDNGKGNHPNDPGNGGNGGNGGSAQALLDVVPGKWLLAVVGSGGKVGEDNAKNEGGGQGGRGDANRGGNAGATGRSGGGGGGGGYSSVSTWLNSSIAVGTDMMSIIRAGGGGGGGGGSKGHSGLDGDDGAMSVVDDDAFCSQRDEGNPGEDASEQVDGGGGGGGGAAYAGAGGNGGAAGVDKQQNAEGGEGGRTCAYSYDTNWELQVINSPLPANYGLGGQGSTYESDENDQVAETALLLKAGEDSDGGDGFILIEDATPEPQAVAPIPTLSEWALLLLSGLLGAFTFLRVRGRSH